jgi:hypothetical protein
MEKQKLLLEAAGSVHHEHLPTARGNSLASAPTPQQPLKVAAVPVLQTQCRG